MSAVEDATIVLSEVNLGAACKPLDENKEADTSPKELAVTIGATVPTGFEVTAADEVQEKLGSKSRISKDRGKIYFEIPVTNLPQVCRLHYLSNICSVCGSGCSTYCNHPCADFLDVTEGIIATYRISPHNHSNFLPGFFFKNGGATIM